MSNKPIVKVGFDLKKISSCHYYNTNELTCVFRGENNLRFVQKLLKGEITKELASKEYREKYKRRQLIVPVYATPSFLVALFYAAYYSSGLQRGIEEIAGFRPYETILCFVKPKILATRLKNEFLHYDNEVIIDLNQTEEIHIMSRKDVWQRRDLLDFFFRETSKIFKTSYSFEDLLYEIVRPLRRTNMFHLITSFDEYLDYLILTNDIQGIYRIFKVFHKKLIIRKIIKSCKSKMAKHYIDVISNYKTGEVKIEARDPEKMWFDDPTEKQEIICVIEKLRKAYFPVKII